MTTAIKDAIVEMLEADPLVTEWATGGIHVHRAPPMIRESEDRRRDKYVVVRVTESLPVHTQDAPSQLTTDRIEASVWASSSRDADEGANLVRLALDGATAEAAGVSVQRIFWQGTTDREVEDASAAEQLIDGAILEFDVGYTVQTPITTPPPVVYQTITVVIEATKDADLNLLLPNSNSGTSTVLDVGLSIANPLVAQRSVLHFDLSVDLAADGVLIDEAILDLYSTTDYGTPPHSGHVCRFTNGSWVEITITWNSDNGSFTTSDPAGVPWNTYDAGGPFGVVPSNIDIATLAQDAYDNRSKQLHIMLKVDDESGAVAQGNVFRSKDATQSSERPKLTVTYRVPV